MPSPRGASIISPPHPYPRLGRLGKGAAASRHRRRVGDQGPFTPAVPASKCGAPPGPSRQVDVDGRRHRRRSVAILTSILHRKGRRPASLHHSTVLHPSKDASPPPGLPLCRPPVQARSPPRPIPPILPSTILDLSQLRLPQPRLFQLVNQPVGRVDCPEPTACILRALARLVSSSPPTKPCPSTSTPSRPQQ